MESIDKWFKREVLQWRSGASVTWSVLSIPVLTSLYLLFGNFKPLHPFEWFAGFAGSIFSLSGILTVAVIAAINAGFYVYSCNTFTVISSVNVRRFSQISQLIRSTVLIYTLVCVSSGFILGLLTTSLMGGRYYGLSVQCTQNRDEFCVNEHHLFLVLYGGYTGFMYVMYHYVAHSNVLVFPTVQQAKFFRVRASLMKLGWKSLSYVIWQIKYFYLLYYFFGGLVRDGIAETLSLQQSSGVRLDSMYGLLLDVKLLWQTVLLAIYIQFSWSFGALLYKVYNTEYYEFAISTMFDNFKNKCLVDAMSCTTMPLLQALGFLDLDILSKQSFVRRKELFSLSQPGGHPHNWNKILSVCLSVIQELNDSVQEVNWKILANAPVRQPNLEKSVSNGSSNGVKHKSSEDTSKTTIKEKVLSGLKRRLRLGFFTGEVPDNTHKQLFSSAFIQVWAVEALSSLVVASYSEDSFGVVQMSLRDILTALLHLHENIDKFFKLTGGINRRVQKDGTDVPLKYLLHAALKSSIYAIVNTFGKHLMDIGMDSDMEKRLQHFLDFRE